MEEKTSDLEKLKRLEFLDLLQLTEIQIKSLQESIAKSQGTIHLWVHSHYEGGDSNRFLEQRESEKLLTYNHRRQKTYSQNLKSPVPTISLVGTEYTGKFTPRIENNKSKIQSENPNLAGKIYYLNTFPHDPAPLMYENQDNSYYTNAQECWDMFQQLLKEFGVRNIIISGRNYNRQTFEDSKGEPRTISNLCVSKAEEELFKRGFNIFISNVTFPYMKD